MRISDWSSDVCSSDLLCDVQHALLCRFQPDAEADRRPALPERIAPAPVGQQSVRRAAQGDRRERRRAAELSAGLYRSARRSEEHTSELQSLLRISYAVFCLKKNIKYNTPTTNQHQN